MAGLSRLSAAREGSPLEIEFIVPARNEAERLAAALVPQLEHFAGRARFTVVLDHCTDETADVVERLESQHPHLSCFDLSAARGKGSAVLEGFRRSTADIVGFMDADCPTPPVEIDRLLVVLEDADGVIASRYLPRSLIASPRTPVRTVASRALNIAVRALFGLPYRDTQCGAKLFWRRAITPILPQISTRNWLFDVDLLVAARMRGLEVVELPIIWCEREGSHLDVIGFAPEAARSLIALRMRAWRFRPELEGRLPDAPFATPHPEVPVPVAMGEPRPMSHLNL